MAPGAPLGSLRRRPLAQADMYTYCQKERRSYLETLEDFPSVSLPLDRFAEVVPLIRPRLFSISSAMVWPLLCPCALSGPDLHIHRRKTRRSSQAGSG